MLYYVGLKGGEALLRRKFRGGQVERALDKFRRYGVAAVIVPSMLPPPVPLKLFVLAAGVAGMRPVTFAASVAIGRGLRYLVVGVLAYYFAEKAGAYLSTYGTQAGIVAGCAAAIILAVYYWRHRSPRDGRA